MAKRLLFVGTAVWLLIAPAGAFAQTADQPLSDLLGDLYFDVGFEHIDRLAAAALAVGIPPARVLDALRVGSGQFEVSANLNKRIAGEVASFPLGSSAAGFTYTFVPETATWERSSDSFGPTFVERALTLGRNRFNIGVNYQRATFDKLEGQDLRGGDIRVYTGLVLAENAGVFFEDALELNLATDTVGVFANYGVTDQLDLGVAVPIIRVSMDAAIVTRIGTISGGVPADELPIEERRSGSAFGVGDVVVRAKYNFLKRAGGGLAAGVDYRAPTGDELDLLGVAGYQSKFYIAASGTADRFSPHFNFGYTFSGESESAASADTLVFAPSDELSYAGGVDVAVTPRLTVVGDLIGRTFRNSFRLEEGATEFGPRFREFYLTEANVPQMLGAAGVKWSPGGTSLISGNVLFPLTENGLTDNLTWVVGIDFAF